MQLARSRMDREDDGSETFSASRRALENALRSTRRRSYAHVAASPTATEESERSEETPRQRAAVTVNYRSGPANHAPTNPSDRNLLSLNEFLRESAEANARYLAEEEANNHGQPGAFSNPGNTNGVPPLRLLPQIEDYMTNWRNNHPVRSGRSTSPDINEEYDDFEQIVSQIRQIGSVHDAMIRAQLAAIEAGRLVTSINTGNASSTAAGSSTSNSSSSSSSSDPEQSVSALLTRVRARAERDWNREFQMQQLRLRRSRLRGELQPEGNSLSTRSLRGVERAPPLRTLADAEMLRAARQHQIAQQGEDRSGARWEVSDGTTFARVAPPSSQSAQQVAEDMQLRLRLLQLESQNRLQLENARRDVIRMQAEAEARGAAASAETARLRRYIESIRASGASLTTGSGLTSGPLFAGASQDDEETVERSSPESERERLRNEFMNATRRLQRGRIPAALWDGDEMEGKGLVVTDDHGLERERDDGL